jgi:hypothetical protein
MLTTKSVGITSETANPKPVTGFDYAGQPMKPGSHYNGRPEHCDPAASTSTSTVAAGDAPKTRMKRKRRSAWTKEARAAFSQRMREYWAKRNAGPTPAP